MIDEQIAHGIGVSHLIVISALLAGLILSALTYWAIHGVTRPLGKLVAAMQSLAAGSFDVVLPGLHRKDEVGAMAMAVERFKVKAMEHARRKAEEDEALQRTAADERRASMRRLADSFEAAVGSIVDTVSSASTELEAAAGTLTQHRRDHAGALRRRRGRASEEASDQRPVGRVGDRGDDRFGDRDQPPGAGVEHDRRRSGAAGGTDRRPHQRAVAGGGAHRRRRQADHRDRRADQPARAQRHHRGGARRRSRPRLRGGRVRRSRRSPRRPPRRPRRSARRSPACSPRRRNWSPRSRRSAGPSAASPRSPARSPPRSRSRAPPPRRSRATSQQRRARHRAGRRPTSPTSIAAAGETGSASGQVLASAQSLVERRQQAQARGREVPGDRARGLSPSASRLMKNSPRSFRDAAKRRARNPVTAGFPAVLDSGFAPSARPGMTARSFSPACQRRHPGRRPPIIAGIAHVRRQAACKQETSGGFR